MPEQSTAKNTTGHRILPSPAMITTKYAQILMLPAELGKPSPRLMYCTCWIDRMKVVYLQ